MDTKEMLENRLFVIKNAVTGKKKHRPHPLIV
jgi:hypothetical protein